MKTMSDARTGHRDDPTLPRLTTRQVNKALANAGIKGELVQGNGYLYFVGDDFDRCYSTSVAVCWLNDLSLSAWLDEARELLQGRD